MKNILKSLSAFLISSVVFLTTSCNTFAISDSMLRFFNDNGIYYYDPSGSDKSCYPGAGSYDGTPTAGLSELQAAFVDQYHDIAEALDVEYGIPWETVMAQGILESASGTSRYARERNNFFGIGAFDSNPDNAFSYATPAEGWRGYFENIKNTPTYRAHGAFNYPGDPYGYLQAIKDAGYATAEHYVSAVGAIVAAVENRAKEKGWKSSAELAEEYNLTGEGGSEYTSYSTCAGEGNGDINATALALSWPDRTHALDDPKPEYRTALGVVGLDHYGEKWVEMGASCDAFVATVLRYSGADPDVVCCGAANMLAYFISHPELYEEIPNIGSTSNLQPGDIRSKPSHIELYVVDEDGNSKIASASHADRTADHACNYYADSSYRIFRRKSN